MVTTNNTISSPITRYYAWQKSIFRDETLRKLAGQGLRRKPADIRATATYLATFGTNGQNCRPAIGTLAGNLGFSVNTIKDHLATLVSHGWFTVRTVPGRPTVYSITIPGEHQGVANLDCLPLANVDCLRPRTYNQEHKDQEHRNQDQVQNLDQEHQNRDGTSVPPDQEPKGPWCKKCSGPILSNAGEHDEDHWDDFTCTACNSNTMCFSFSDRGKPRYSCNDCETYLYQENNSIAARKLK